MSIVGALIDLHEGFGASTSAPSCPAPARPALALDHETIDAVTAVVAGINPVLTAVVAAAALLA